jgi:sugar/nucleoside kinase (ribokinase family)
VLVALGDLVEDIVVWTAGAMRHGTDTASVIERRRGGSAANVVVFAAGVGQPCRFVGCVGADRAGDALLADLVAHGVEASVVRRGRTGTIVVVVSPGGERSFLTDRGAAVLLDELPDGALDRARHLHVSAYSLSCEPVASVVSAALGAARQRAMTVSVDVASCALIDEIGVAEMREWLCVQRPDVLLANEDEAAQLDLLARPIEGVGLTIVKRGARPVLLVHADGSHLEVDVPLVEHVRDTTGAGDAFAAGFLVARLRGLDERAAAEAGVALAAGVLGQPGASTAR